MSVLSIQSPTGGINRLDSIDDMPSSDAIYLDNWIPDAGRCRLRGGSEQLVNVGPDPIGTLVSYGPQFIAASGGVLYDTGFSPSAGNGPPSTGSVTEIGSGFSSDMWEWEVFNNVLLLVNGVDIPQKYDGLTLEPLNFTSGVTNPEEFTGCEQFKGRVFYWKDSECGFYYAEAGSYQGDLTFFDLSIWVDRLSTLSLFFQWSVDAGDGTDDFAVFVTNTGEVLVYQGTDPSSIDYWSLAGKYRMGAPISGRSSTSIAGDELVLTREGWQNFKVIWETGDWRDDGLGRKIVGLATQAAELYGWQQGWEVNFFPEDRLIIVNVPNGSGVFVQHVLNTNTMAWCTFSGWPSTTYGHYNGQMFFGDPVGNIYIANYGNDDGGVPITTDALPAFNYMDGRASQKLITGVRPITTIDRPDTIGLAATCDYNLPDIPPANYIPTITESSPWGSPWGSPWSTGTIGYADGEWQTANCFGYAGSYRMSTKTTDQPVNWYSTQVMFKPGGVM